MLSGKEGIGFAVIVWLGGFAGEQNGSQNARAKNELSGGEEATWELVKEGMNLLKNSSAGWFSQKKAF